MNIQLSAHLTCREEDVFVISHHKLEPFYFFAICHSRLSRCVRIRRARQEDWPLQAEKPPAVVGDAHVGVEAAADQRWSGALCKGTHDEEGLCVNKTGSSAHLSVKPSPPGILPWYTEGAEERHHSRSSRLRILCRSARSPTCKPGLMSAGVACHYAPLTLYSRATCGRRRRGAGRCRHEPLPGARRRCRPRRNQYVGLPRPFLLYSLSLMCPFLADSLNFLDHLY
jgi:hypothetical protein